MRTLAWCVFLLVVCIVPVQAHEEGEHALSHDHGSAHHQADQADVDHQWEGSTEGKAYSEFNHHLAGLCVIFIGLSEVRYGLSASLLAWTRFLLPIFMVAVGAFLLIFSDHEGWPFGSTFAQAFLTGQWETIQHKWFGISALAIGTIEWLRRTGLLTRDWWKLPLPIFAIIGGFSLFLHNHGPHPGAHQIALHHAAMGIMAVSAGSSKFLSDWRNSSYSTGNTSRGELAWAGLILLIGIQLLLYSE